MSFPRKIAFVQDALPFQGGAERVLEAALEVFPDAAIYTLVYNAPAFRGTPIAARPVKTSFIDRLPSARRHHRLYFPLMPLAVERFDLRDFDIVISFSYAAAHGVLTGPHQLHFSYIHTPMRYAWQSSEAFLSDQSSWPVPLRWVLRRYLASFRRWDRAAADRAGRIAAPSQWMAGCIERAYRRPAEVIYPPVDVDTFRPLGAEREEYYITLGRLVRNKRVDLIVAAFNRLGLPLLVVGEGPEMERLRRSAAANVTLLGWQPRERAAELLGRAKGFIHAGEEDFGIAMVEAQAAGCPVIALGRGGALEIVQPGLTGAFFAEQTPASLEEAVRRFEVQAPSFDPCSARENALRFGRSHFLDRFSNWVEQAWEEFASGIYARKPAPAGERLDQDGF